MNGTRTDNPAYTSTYTSKNGASITYRAWRPTPDDAQFGAVEIFITQPDPANPDGLPAMLSLSFTDFNDFQSWCRDAMPANLIAAKD